MLLRLCSSNSCNLLVWVEVWCPVTVGFSPTVGWVNADRRSAHLPSLPAELEELRSYVLEYAVRRGEFKLKSGRTSSWFLDAKQVPCRARGLMLMAEVMLKMIPAGVDAIGGLTMGADPVAYGVAAVGAIRGRDLRSFSVRKETKEYGIAGRVAGALEVGDRVVITEDTVTRGASLLEAIEVTREFGAEPVLVTVIVDRGGTCAELCAQAGVEYRPLLTAPDLGFEFGS